MGFGLGDVVLLADRLLLSQSSAGSGAVGGQAIGVKGRLAEGGGALRLRSEGAFSNAQALERREVLSPETGVRLAWIVCMCCQWPGSRVWGVLSRSCRQAADMQRENQCGRSMQETASKPPVDRLLAHHGAVRAGSARHWQEQAVLAVAAQCCNASEGWCRGWNRER